LHPIFFIIFHGQSSSRPKPAKNGAYEIPVTPLSVAYNSD